MRKSNAFAAQTEPAELEFPDWSGMDDLSPRIRPETAFELCEQYAAQFLDGRRKQRSEPFEKCDVEFTL